MQTHKFTILFYEFSYFEITAQREYENLSIVVAQK